MPPAGRVSPLLPTVVIGTMMALWNAFVYILFNPNIFKVVLFFLLIILTYPLVYMSRKAFLRAIALYVSMMLLFSLVMVDFRLSEFAADDLHTFFSEVFVPWATVFGVDILLMCIGYLWLGNALRRP